MSSSADRLLRLSHKRLALLALELEARLDAAGNGANLPIAVIGIGCRFPGGADPDAFWRLLREGRDAIGDIPPDRWAVDDYYDPDPDQPGTIAARKGAFLDRIDLFDPEFFAIAPREALSMDPQQRLALEVAWEALEHAGIAPGSLAGTPTGVFLGISSSDYQLRALIGGNAAIDAHLASGNAHGIASGRIAYVLGLQGPALSIDTACSASLVSVHSAMQSLRAGECSLALAGGVNVICAPEAAIAASRSHLMAPDGRCKTFDAAADGYGRGEGCGLIVLKRLADAERSGDRVLAVLAGSALNQDGRSSGLTVPNGPAQEAVVRAALANARRRPEDIDYVEAHGSGTSLGDPIEVGALANVVGDGRSASEPLLIGSVKTNIGHLEAAAGIAGLIKVVLALEHEEIPPHLNFSAPSPFIEWDRIPVRVAAKAVAWQRGARVRRAGVSSFGFSGTNAHVIVEEAPVRPVRRSSDVDRPRCLPLSARSEAALYALASRYADALALRPSEFDDIAYTAATGRTHLAERAVIVAADPAEAVASLRALADRRADPAVRRGRASQRTSRHVVFLYTGAGAQYAGMGRGLYDMSPVFRDAIDRCDALVERDAKGRTLKDVLWPADGDVSIHDMGWTQPALFAVEFAATQLWRSWGIEPAAVIGHSTGEYAAACTAGVFGLEDGLRLVAERGRLLQALPPGGAMATVFAPVDEVARLVASFAERLAIAAINAPEHVVVSGEAGPLDELLDALTARGIETQRVMVPLGAHSPLVDPALDAMHACANRVTMQPPALPVAWNLASGAPGPGRPPDAAYWRRHMREPVAFARGMTSLYDQGYRVFLEVGPHPALLTMAQATLPIDGVSFVASMRRGKDEWREWMTALAELHATGIDVDWTRVYEGPALRATGLPTSPFERRSFWIEQPAAETARLPVRRGGPLLGGRRLATPQRIVERVLSPDAPPWLGDHRVHGTVVVPGPVMIEMAQAGLHEGNGTVGDAVLDFRVHEALLLPAEGRVVQVHYSEAPDGATAFALHGRPTRDLHAWTLHATGRVARENPLEAGDTVYLEALARRLDTPVDCAAYYERLSDAGIELGPAFRCLERAQSGESEALALVACPEGHNADTVAWSHPPLVDAALQAVGLALASRTDRDDTYFLAGIGRAMLAGRLPGRFWCHARLESGDGIDKPELRATLQLLGVDGRPIGRLDEVVLHRASVADVAPQAMTRRWLPSATTISPALDRHGRYIVVDDDAGTGAVVGAGLVSRGMEVDVIGRGELSDYAPSAVADRLGDAGNGAVAWLIDCACEPDPPDDALPRAASAVGVRHLAFAQALDRIAPTAGICLLTRGTQAVLDDEAPAARASAALGLSRTIGNERGGRALRVDLDPRRSADAAFVLAAMAGDDEEVAVRDGRALVPRLQTSPAGDRTLQVRGAGTYLVTGGSGALGMSVAEWLASEGAGHIALLSRHGTDESGLARIREAGRAAVQVRSVTVDVGDYSALSTAWGRDLSVPPIRGIVHTAGVLDDAPLAEQSADRLRTVARAKIEGSWNLHRLSVGAPLDFFVLFSSAAAWFGNPGQANYAAANAFLDGLAEYRRRRGLPATSIAWGPWDDGRGMAARASDDLWRRWKRQGLGRLRPEDALRALAGAAANNAPPTAVLAFSQARFVAQAPPLVQRLFGVVPRRVQDEAADESREIAARLGRATTPCERRTLVGNAVRHRAARILGLDLEALEDEAPLVAFGLDSLMAVQLKNALQSDIGVAVSVSQVLRSTSLQNLSDLVATALEARIGERAADDRQVAQVWEEGSL